MSSILSVQYILDNDVNFSVVIKEVLMLFRSHSKNG